MIESSTLDFGSCTITLQGVDDEGFCWLSASCVGSRSTVMIEGYTEMDELIQWQRCITQMHERLEGTCSFSFADPDFTIKLNCNKLGQIIATVIISANPDAESHEYRFDLDQSYLPTVLAGLRRYLESVNESGTAGHLHGSS